MKKLVNFLHKTCSMYSESLMARSEWIKKGLGGITISRTSQIRKQNKNDSKTLNSLCQHCLQEHLVACLLSWAASFLGESVSQDTSNSRKSYSYKMNIAGNISQRSQLQGHNHAIMETHSKGEKLIQGAKVKRSGISWWIKQTPVILLFFCCGDRRTKMLHKS